MTNNNHSKPKILYIITQGEWGGAQRYVYDLATKLSKDFEIYVAIGEAYGKKDLQNKFPISNFQFPNKSQIQIIQLKHLVRQISPIHDILAIFELAKLYKTIKPDIIHLNSSKAGIIGSLATISYKLKAKSSIIYTVHGWVFNEPTRKLGKILYRFLEKWTAKIKDKIIVLSDRDLNDGIKLGIDKNKLVKIPLGIERPEFLSKEEARRFLMSACHSERSETKPRNPLNNVKEIPPLSVGMTMWIGTIANLYKTKGLDVLIEAVKILSLRAKRSNPTEIEIASSLSAPRNDMQFIIIGEGPERKKLQLLITNYQLQNVHLLGIIENAAQYLKAFDLFVLPSRKEGLPYTILEAKAAGVPIVATAVGGIAELVENTIPPDNPEILAEAIITSLNNPKSTKNKSLTIEKMIEETKKVYLTSKINL